MRWCIPSHTTIENAQFHFTALMIHLLPEHNSLFIRIYEHGLKDGAGNVSFLFTLYRLLCDHEPSASLWTTFDRLGYNNSEYGTNVTLRPSVEAYRILETRSWAETRTPHYEWDSKRRRMEWRRLISPVKNASKSRWAHGVSVNQEHSGGRVEGYNFRPG